MKQLYKNWAVHMRGNSVSPAPMTAIARANNYWSTNELQKAD